MSALLLLVVLLMMPWKIQYWPRVLSVQVVNHLELPCDALAWWDESAQVIHLCDPYKGELRWPPIVLHETQHAMASFFLVDPDWNEFGQQAMSALDNDGYSDEQRWKAEFSLSLSGAELHADLPGITQGQIPPILAPWYPWFSLK